MTGDGAFGAAITIRPALDEDGPALQEIERLAGERFRLVADLGDRGHVQRMVELAVPAGVEPVADVGAAGTP